MERLGVSAMSGFRAYRVGVISAELPLSRTTTDRAADLRERPDLVAALLTDPTTRVLMVHDGSVVTRGEGNPELVLLPPRDRKSVV